MFLFTKGASASNILFSRHPEVSTHSLPNFIPPRVF
jgi:hypothetical protein